MSKKEFDRRLEVAIPLEFPKTVDGQTYTSLTMRRPTTADGIAAAEYKGSEGRKGLFLFARLCNVSPDVIEALDEIDSQALGEQHSAFTGRQSV